MGIATGKMTWEVRTTGKGSDHYGACEVCGKESAEICVGQNQREYKRENGELYASPVGRGVYGHRDCASKEAQR